MEEDDRWIPTCLELDAVNAEVERAATILFRLTDYASRRLKKMTDQLTGKSTDQKHDQKHDQKRDGPADESWIISIKRIREASEQFVQKIVIDGGVRKFRPSKRERKRAAKDAVMKQSGVFQEREENAKRLKMMTPSNFIPDEKDSKDSKDGQKDGQKDSIDANGSNVYFTNWKSVSKNVLVEDDFDESRHGAGPVVQGKCYTCHKSYTLDKRHSHYPKMCTPCGDLNKQKHDQTANLTGRYALVTGARVKIGFEIALKLLRAGCHVIATTRLPKDAMLRYATQKDFAEFRDRLVILAIDLRDYNDISKFIDKIKKIIPRLDILINNAAQTIRRPPAFYKHLLPNENKPLHLLLPTLFTPLLNPPAAAAATSPSLALMDGKDEKDMLVGEWIGSSGACRSVLQTQVVLLPEDAADYYPHSTFPEGKLDAHQQQIDLRPKNSWITKPEEITAVELAETHMVNSIAPFLLFQGLLPLLRSAVKNLIATETATSATSASAASASGSGAPANVNSRACVVNVSAEEGTFDRPRKDVTHLQTNMAKASMNMFTRTAAEWYAAQDRILINSVDTGWIDDMTPLTHLTGENRPRFVPPLNDVDGAARVLDPVFLWYRQGIAHHGFRFKDYAPAAW